MTISDLVRQMNVSKPTFYRRIKEAGISVDELRETNSKHVSAIGIQKVAALFDDVERQKERADAPEACQNPATPQKVEQIEDESAVIIARLEGKIEALERENALLREMVNRADATAKQSLLDAEAWRTEYQRTTKLLQAGQQRHGILSRIFGKKKQIDMTETQNHMEGSILNE